MHEEAKEAPQEGNHHHQGDGEESRLRLDQDKEDEGGQEKQGKQVARDKQDQPGLGGQVEKEQ